MIDFLVIGGGIAGLSAGARLSELGTVTVLEGEDALGYHANGLAESAARAKAAFEQNTAGQGTEKTTAKDNIWDGPEFMEGMDAMAKATADLAAAVEANDMAAIGAAAQAVGGSCKSCHDKFRVEH